MRKEIVTCDRCGKEVDPGDLCQNVTIKIEYDTRDGKFAPVNETINDLCNKCLGYIVKSVEVPLSCYQKKGGKE